MAFLMHMEGARLECITSEKYKDEFGRRSTVGIKVIFKGQMQAVSFGVEGTTYNKVVFNDL
jgi:hypothetical protein